ncbi:PREDICTED: nuclear transcription factor Y subunit C-2-like [Lupinus angustifolius]|uniref:nuclear transcription factor Y subunit C-2-like n=1 Tax=Lupinus angustifolius TaxID=3871 RepID=UPI00092FA7A5|nr:PREDICTED: nuclear transcription factor Y subunit C-2-like [Lupinus angustifolius]
MHIQKQSLQQFWVQQLLDIRNTEAFRNNKQLPLSRIKRIVKADKDVKMVSAEVPLFMAKACEIFIQELTLRAWILTQDKESCTLQNGDIAKAVQKIHVLHFLTNLLHCDQLQFYEVDLFFFLFLNLYLGSLL